MSLFCPDCTEALEVYGESPPVDCGHCAEMLEDRIQDGKLRFKPDREPTEFTADELAEIES